MRTRMITPLATTIALALALLIGTPALFAQGTPEVGESGEVVHPAHIHEGACPDVGDVVHPLNDVTPIGTDTPPLEMDATPAAGNGQTMDATPTDSGDTMMDAATPAAEGQTVDVVESTTLIEATLDELMDGEYAVNVHESPENMETYIACGDVTGERTGFSLQVELQELNDSGYTGRATLTDNDDGTVTVTITMGPVNPAATPAATPMN